MSDIKGQRKPTLQHMEMAFDSLNKGFRVLKRGLDEIRDDTSSAKDRVIRMGQRLEEVQVQKDSLNWDMELSEDWACSD